MKSFLTKPTTCLRTRLGRISCEKECKEQQAVSERAQDLVQILRNLLAIKPAQVWPGSSGNDIETALDLGKVRVFEEPGKGLRKVGP